MQFLHRLEAWYSHEYYDRKISTIFGTPFIKTHFKTIILWIQDTDCPKIVDSAAYCCIQPGELCQVEICRRLFCHLLTNPAPAMVWRRQQTSDAATAAGSLPEAPHTYCLHRVWGEVWRWKGRVRRHINNAIFDCSSKLNDTKNL